VKVTYVFPQPYSYRPSGGFKVVYEYANHLVRLGHEVTIVHPKQLRRFATNRSRRQLRRWLSRQKALFAHAIRKSDFGWFAIDNEIKLVYSPDLDAHYVPEADAIFATAWQTAVYINQYPREKGTKFYLVQDFAPWLGDKSEIEQTWLMPFKKVAVSSWLAELVRQSGAPEHDTQVIPNAIDHDRFRVTNDVRRRPKRIIMLYDALHPYKRSEWGVRALLKCKEALPELEATLFGQEPRRPRKLPSWIEYHGRVSENELVKLYNAASVYLCSSAAEGFALPPAEAMACGCAVATTDCGGNREYAKDEETALVCDPDDFASLVRNTLRLLSDEELRMRIALSGRERIMQFTWERNVQQLLEFMRDDL
jgi:glycosyltransferase involved in cell wall biosynthesis